MAPRTRKVRFYVYRIFDGIRTIYVGKGSGGRLKVQQKRFGFPGEILKWFSSERDAYSFEREMIAQLRPELNRHPGGNGSRAQVRTIRRFDWEIEMDRIGSRAYAARLLLKFDTRAFIEASKLEAIRQVAYGAG